MTELGMGADLLRLVGGVFWLVVFGALLAAYFLPKTRKNRAIALSTVLVLFAAFPGRWAWNDFQVQRDYRARLADATARFNERCKTAGEKIYKTVEGVEGVMLLKLRPTNYNAYDQKAVDPYGHDYDWEDTDSYIGSFLRWRDAKGVLIEKIPDEKPGYRYAEAVDPKDGIRYRYTAYMGIRPEHVGKTKSESFLLKREPSSGPQPRYGITYDDITTQEERALWIAGSSLRVIDTETKEVIAERIGYMVDFGLGNKAGGRQPWTHAKSREGWSCPQHVVNAQTRKFVEKVLKIKVKAVKGVSIN